jgi:parallel beta-helix repeat protein
MLTIEPGVDVNFQGLIPLTVNGLLEAVGTETDSIHFFPADIGVSWWGILFENAPDSSHLAYCTVSYVGNFIFGYGGIRCTNSNPVITHCRISNNNSRLNNPTYGGGIALNNSNAEISWCNITNNYSSQSGGGINIYDSSPVITGCNISGNEVIQYGGGICILGNSSPIITNCTIENNTSNVYGGGILAGNLASGSVVTISECTVGYNHADTWGGGISIHSGSVFLDHCIIERNNCMYTVSSGKGGGIFTDGGVLTVDHCTFYGNENDVGSNSYGMEIHTEGTAAMTVTNSIFRSFWNFWTIVFNSTVPASVSYNNFTSEVHGAETQRFMGNVPPGLGVLTQVNTNGDPCDVYYNIFLDPLFENPGSGNFKITWANWPNPDYTKSPCIDAGDPEFASDRDSTITDIGRYFFDQSVPKITFSSSILDFGSVLIGEQADSVLKIYNAGLDTLVINQLFNDEAVFSTDYNPADNMILPGDSISITVTFTPVGTVPVIDTIHIYNNDQDSIVKLTGTGQSPTGIFDLSGVITKKYLLRPPYPNPASSYTTFEIDLPRQSFIINGTYLLKLQAGEYKEVRKIVLLR